MNKSTRFFLFFLLLCPLLLLSVYAVSCPSCGSTMESMSSNNPPSCTTGGTLSYICPNCQTGMSVQSGPLGHEFAEDPLQEPTCTEPGLSYCFCTRCEYSYEKTLSALGHNFVVTEEESPGCESEGYREERCSRCRATRSQTLPATLHFFAQYPVTEPSCTDEGLTECRCRNCELVYYQKVNALGHDFELVEEKEPGCTEDGFRLEKCTREGCKEEQKEIFPATGHDYKETITEPSCEKDGEKVICCRNCGEESVEILPALSHEFTDWELTREPTRRAEGEEKRRCKLCGFEETQSVEKRSSLPLILSVIGGSAAAGGLGYALLKLLRPAAKAAGTAAAAEGGMITLQMKALLLCWADSPAHSNLEEKLKKRAYLDVKKPDGSKQKPALVVFDAASAPELREKLASCQEQYSDARLACLAADSLPESELEQAKAEKALLSYARESDSDERKLLRLVAPLYSFGESKGLYAENATLLTDALGLPFLSTLLNLYVVGGDVKEAIAAKGDLGTADWADMVNDVAGLLGLGAIGDAAEVLRVGADQTERIEDKNK